MRAMLVAAGFGTRLAPLTSELPKPALPVGNRPIAAYALEHLALAGVRDVVVNTHHLGDRLWAALEPWCPHGVQLSRKHELTILGTGGGVRNAFRPMAGEDFVVMNAKVLFAFDLQRALELHRASGAIATLVVQELPRGASFAPIAIDAEGRVRAIRNLPHAALGLRQCLFTGVQLLSERAHRDLPETGDVFERAYLPWLARGERVQAVIDDAPFRDVGVSLTGYLDANLALATGELRWPGMQPSSSAVLSSAGVSIPDGTRIDRAVLGEECRIGPGLRISNVVAWPHTRIDSDLDRAIVTPSAVVRV